MGNDNGNGRNVNEIVLVKAEKTVGNRYNDKKTGKFIEDNPGRPKGQKNYLTLIEEALTKEAKKAGVTYWEKLAGWGMTNPMSGFALLKKFIPDKEKIEHSGIEPINITIQRADAKHNG